MLVILGKLVIVAFILVLFVIGLVAMLLVTDYREARRRFKEREY